MEQDIAQVPAVPEAQSETQQDVGSAEVAATPVAAPQAQPNPHDGIQKRIDELTAKAYQAQRMAEEASAREAKLMELLVNQHAQPAPAPQQPEFNIPDNVDPEQVRIIENIVRRTTAQYESKQAQFEQFLSQQRLQQAAAQVNDPGIADAASRIYADWNKRSLKGWNPEDALVYAAGQKYLEAQKQSAAAQNTRQQFARVEQPLSAQAAPAPVTTSSARPIPANIDSWPFEKQAEFWEQRLKDTGQDVF